MFVAIDAPQPEVHYRLQDCYDYRALINECSASMEFKDYYQILGVSPEAETGDIKSAYRRLARKYHPDLNPEKDAEEKFKEVAEAWEVLKDKKRRAEYDELRRYGGRHQQHFEPPPGWESTAGGDFGPIGADFSEFFHSIFGGTFTGGQRGQWRQFDIRGQDIEIQMPVFLEETLADTQKHVNFEIPSMEQGSVGTIKKNLKVTVPAGVADGERIRVRGQGAPGMGKAPPGDLYLHIRLVPHPLFDVEGHNLLITVPIAPWEAALGTKVLVPTLEGKVSLTITPGSRAGQKLRVRGKGLVGKTGKGDLFAVLKVVMPPSASAEVKALWQELSEKAAFDPRAGWGRT